MNNGESDPRPELYLWGERGLVASFFLDVSADPSFDRWEKFLRLIRFPYLGRVTGAWSVVEPVYGNKGFGHPDLVARLAFEGGLVAVLILEAKLTTYYKASCPMSRRLRNKQFNSKLNGQIELNHRLALALEEYRPEQDRELREPGWLAGSDYVMLNGRPRALKNESARRLLADLLAGKAAEEYHHVIITTDITTDENNSPASQEQNADRRPLILVRGNEGTVINQWERFSSRFHHCNWESMRQMAESWGNSLFATNYAFFGSRLSDSLMSVSQAKDESLSPEGVRLLALQPDPNNGLTLRRPTYIHLSWKKGGCSFRLRDYSESTVPKKIKTFRGKVSQILDRAEHGIPYTRSYRTKHKLKNDSPKWHEIVLNFNRERWPELWPERQCGPLEDVS